MQAAIVNVFALMDGKRWMGEPSLRYHVDTLFFWAHLLSLLRSCGCSVVLSHPQPPLSGTGVLWVLTGIHLCDDPSRQGGGSPERQLVRCVVAWVRALALWISSEGHCRRDIATVSHCKICVNSHV